jgi:thiol-disulfide isomerase/thioredoxin
MNASRLTVALLSGLTILSAEPVQAASPTVNKPAPDFQVETFDGQHLRLSDFKGQVVILNFWATWCGPCKRELPLLNGYYRLRQDRGLRVLAIATEDSVPESKLRPLAAVVSFPLVRRLRGPYRVLEGLPTNYVIDRAGVLRLARTGAFDLDQLNAVLIPLLSEPDPTAAAPSIKPAL